MCALREMIRLNDVDTGPLYRLDNDGSRNTGVPQSWCRLSAIERVLSRLSDSAGGVVATASESGSIRSTCQGHRCSLEAIASTVE